MITTTVSCNCTILKKRFFHFVSIHKITSMLQQQPTSSEGQKHTNEMIFVVKSSIFLSLCIHAALMVCIISLSIFEHRFLYRLTKTLTCLAPLALMPSQAARVRWVVITIPTHSALSTSSYRWKKIVVNPSWVVVVCAVSKKNFKPFFCRCTSQWFIIEWAKFQQCIRVVTYHNHWVIWSNNSWKYILKEILGTL